MKFILPFPPSVNAYWRSPNKGAAKGKLLVSEAGRRFKHAVRAAIIEQLKAIPRPSAANAEVAIVLYPPDYRRRDLDNYNKALFDALTFAGIWEDDSQVKRMAIEWGENVKGGRVEITIKNFRGYLQGETVRLKKYFYVLRPLLAARWVEAGKGVPPMRFAELLAGSELCAPLRAEIDGLLEIKQRAGEAEYGPKRPLLHAFLQSELVRGEVPPVLPDSREGNLKDLDSLLMRTVMKS